MYLIKLSLKNAATLIRDNLEQRSFKSPKRSGENAVSDDKTISEQIS